MIRSLSMPVSRPIMIPRCWLAGWHSWTHRLRISSSPSSPSHITVISSLQCQLYNQLIGKKVKSPILVIELWARSWSWCTGNQPAGDYLSHPSSSRLPLLSARSPSHPKNVAVLQPLLSYTVWWQRHIGVNNLAKVAMQLCPCENWTNDLMITSATLYR